MKIIIGEKTE